jgi:hypothetical protein
LLKYLGENSSKIFANGGISWFAQYSNKYFENMWIFCAMNCKYM